MRSTFDFDRIDPLSHLAEPGDVITSARCAYRVVDVRRVESRVWHDRWSAQVEKLGMLPIEQRWRDESIARFGKCMIVGTESYAHGDGPADVARRYGLPITPPAAGAQLELVDVPAIDVAPDELPNTEVRFIPPTDLAAARHAGLPAIAEIRHRHGIGTDQRGGR